MGPGGGESVRARLHQEARARSGGNLKYHIVNLRRVLQDDRLSASRGSTRRRSRRRLSQRQWVRRIFRRWGADPTQLRGPDFKRLDLSIFKGFRSSGNQRFEARIEIFNLTNTHNFSVTGFSGGRRRSSAAAGRARLHQYDELREDYGAAARSQRSEAGSACAEILFLTG